MNRREFIRLGLATGVTALCGTHGAVLMAANSPRSQRTLVLVELKGGNDGLNTLVPFNDSQYYRLRPRLGIKREMLVHLDHRFGLHPSLSPLSGIWNQKELALVQGVGYPNPNRSHFRSIEIWETGSDAEEFLDQGWLVPMLNAQNDATPVVLDKVSSPVFAGYPGTLVMDDVQRFLARAKKIQAAEQMGGNSALSHLLRVESGLQSASQDLAREVGRKPLVLKQAFARNAFGKSLEQAVQLMASGLDIPVIKLSLGSFDTHRGQLGAQARLLGQLAEGLVQFRTNLMDLGLWQDTLVMSYSEFGRRAAENGSGGTDHGTASTHLVMGGRVKGGLRGQSPSLTRLADGDLRHTTDFRRLYASVEKEWFGQANGHWRSQGFKPLGLVG